MNQQDIIVNINLQFINEINNPAINVAIDDLIMNKTIGSTQYKNVQIRPKLNHGKHVLSLEIDNIEYHETKEMAVIIESVKFQYVDTDFKCYSFYTPIYPEEWKNEQLAKGIILADTIHANYMGWNGRWYLNFETPIYAWIHQKTNQGWLI
jgi:hypothetical protein